MAGLARLLNPRSVAVIGGAPAAAVVRQCQKLGYTGEIWPVHPKKADMHGVVCFPTIADLPGVPDAAFVAVNRHLTIDAVAQLRAGAGAQCVTRRDSPSPVTSTCRNSSSSPPATWHSSDRTATAT
ncbi:MAG: hypothetical protein EBQ75_00230 [Actinobacteria bacterium]|nr:hypothetical protein [Actinomycetota bacterium]